MTVSKKDIILVHTGGFHNILFSFMNLGLLSLATFLKGKGFKVICLDNKWFFMLSREALSGLVKNYDPILIGFNTVSDNMYAVEDLAMFFKGILPEVKIALGGPEATVLDKELLKKPYFDLIVRNEGEYTLHELLDFYKYKRGRLKDIKGLTYKENGAIISNPDRKFIENLDMLPIPDHDLIGGQSYLYPIMTGRGCPYRCLFCFGEVLGKKYRYRSSQKVIEEIISGMDKYKLKSLGIFDDTFVTDTERAKEICYGLMKYQKIRKEPFIFFCEGRVDTLSKDLKLLELLKSAGLCRLQIGIESGSQKIIDTFKKDIKLEQVKAVVRACFEIGIPSVVGNFIFGGPGENKETVSETLAFAKELIDSAPGVFEATSSFLVPYPGTKISRNPGQFGLKPLDSDFYKGATLQSPFFETKDLNKGELLKCKRLFENEIFQHMKRSLIKVPEDLIRIHFHLAENYRLFTSWYSTFYKRFSAIDGYYHFKLSSRFKELRQINEKNWQGIFPMRIHEDIFYTDDLSIVLKGSWEEIVLKEEIEKFIYIYSSGRLKLSQLVEKIKDCFGQEGDGWDFFSRILLPFYKKLEEFKYIIFYE